MANTRKSGRPTNRESPDWARALKLRRVFLGLSQEQLAGATGEALSQRTVSDLEVARVNLGDLSMTRVVQLARALRWTLLEMQEATGLDLGMANLKKSEGKLTVAYPLQALVDPTLDPIGTIYMQPYEHPENMQFFIADGDEMVSAQHNAIHPGFSIYFDADQRDLVEGKVYVIIYEGRAHIRKYLSTPIGYAFAPDNLAYPLIPTNVEVLGRVYLVIGVKDDNTLN